MCCKGVFDLTLCLVFIPLTFISMFKNSFLVGKTIIWQSRKHASSEKYINLQLEDFYMLIDFIVSVWHLQWFGSVKRHPIWFVFMIKFLNALGGHMYCHFRFIHYNVYWRTVIHTQAELQTSNPHHVLHSEHWQTQEMKKGWPGWAKMGKQKKRMIPVETQKILRKGELM